MTSIDGGGSSRSTTTSRSSSTGSSTSSGTSSSTDSSSNHSSRPDKAGTPSSTTRATASDELQATEQRAQEQRARAVVGQDAALRAPTAALASTPAAQIQPKRGLGGAANAADAAGSADAADATRAASAPPAEAPSASEVAAEVNELAATDPEGAARVYADSIAANEDAAYRAELTEAAQPGLEEIGRASATGEASTEGSVRELSRASEALHAAGQADTARALADGFAGGVDAASRAHFEQTRMPVGSPALGDAFAAQVGSGQGANFAADVTSSFSARAAEGRAAGLDSGEVQRRENLTANGADGLARGVETLGQRFSDQGAALADRSARLAEADERFGPHLGDEQRAAAHAATADETARRVADYETTAGQLTSAVEASARAYDSVAEASRDTRLLSTAKGSLAFSLDRAVQHMPAAASTLTGQAAMADTVAKQAAGERTWLDTIADVPGVGGDTKRAAFAAATQGAALLGAADYGAGGSLDRAKSVLEHNASALLDERGQGAVREALSQMDGAGSSAEAFTAFADSLERNEDALGGPQVANAFGALGTILGKPEAISDSPAYGRYANGASMLASAAGLALSGPGDTFQERVAFGIGAAHVATDAVELLAPGTRLGSWASVGGRVLGAAGAGLGLIDSLGKGDAVGVASSGLALYGALALNPYAAVAAGVIEGGRFLWDVRQDNIAQGAANAEYLQGAGLSAENADFIGGIGNYGPPLLSEQGERHAGISDLNERIDHYRDGGDYFVPLELMHMSQR